MTGTELRIGVAGAGATGGFLAAALANAGISVTLLTRGESTKVIRHNGIEVRGPGDRRITARPEKVITATDTPEPVDLVIVCVKSYDTEAISRDIAPLVGEDTTILCLQNGIANEEILASEFGFNRLIAGVLYIGAERTAPGLIECSTPARIVLGPYVDDASLDYRCRAAQSAFERADIECDIDADIRASKWQKYLFNCALNPLTALTGQRLGSIRRVEAGRWLFEAMVDEAIATAIAAGAPLLPNAKQLVNSVADRMDISSSMASDLSAGRPMELEAFTGQVLRLAEKYQTDAQVTQVIHALLCVVDDALNVQER